MTGLVNGPRRDGCAAARDALERMPEGPWSVKAARTVERDGGTMLVIEALVQTGEGAVYLSAAEPGARLRIMAELDALLAEPADDGEETGRE